ncbi:GNAT family N-acetyltransferase [uncultured Cetobacterium sp.]|uniref:GNAT family N-acetyltransferase n=1 Tax=uncultured Cetobacterium sp. TaxID=527638 RepID=UPI0026352FE8|nr:GNAT family N-acetyltransferase [uncultured Cetobacterium sp.]
MIRNATENDLDKIMEIINITVKDMETEGNNQWDEAYPNRDIFIKDIKNNYLYLIEEEDIKGVICLNYIEADEYKNINWSLESKALVIHRMAVNSKFRNQGIGSKLLEFAKSLAKENNIKIIKTDTYSKNIKMDNLFRKLNFKQIGVVNFNGKEKYFFCYENLVNL